ncbi:hypothetical protein EVAR_34512_1 [Eumeta japonica]|uniref:Uncharacterized protein n=1 Tax=Eumeta variegata TaxID=151549 RepID=A0A4C1Z4R3_EUMVA|nr:hypothetical protein EVAR_34512_1 [Eumeta japonica]
MSSVTRTGLNIVTVFRPCSIASHLAAYARLSSVITLTNRLDGCRLSRMLIRGEAFSLSLLPHHLSGRWPLILSGRALAVRLVRSRGATGAKTGEPSSPRGRVGRSSRPQRGVLVVDASLCGSHGSVPRSVKFKGCALPRKSIVDVKNSVGGALRTGERCVFLKGIIKFESYVQLDSRSQLLAELISLRSSGIFNEGSFINKYAGRLELLVASYTERFAPKALKMKKKNNH